MRMTIDQAILTIKNAIRFTYDDIYEEAFDMAIDTMRKYQKVQEVMDSRVDDDAKSNSKALSDIEVVMYGNDD